MKLNELRPREGSTHTRKLLGRGIGSGLGKTSGRGVKGQKARTGVRIKGFEGGQMPLHRRLPKRGFNNIFRLAFAEINLDRLQEAIDAKLVDAKEAITAESLVKAGVLRRAKDGLRLLGRGELKAKINIEVHGASKSAVEAVEKAGGTVKILLKPRFGRRRCNGIWPPSKPLMRTPERAVWPLPPRPEVLPLPEPMPRPTRMRFLREPALSAISLSFIAKFLYPGSMILTENRSPLFGITR